MKKSTIKKLHLLADNCIRLQEKERPELAWLKEKHRQIQNSYHLANKTQTDRFLYERMYGHSPTKASDTLKLRYWRTGKYTPGNREQCLLLSSALELSESEKLYLLQQYYDRSTVMYSVQNTAHDPVYEEKCRYLKELTDSYLSRLPIERLAALHIPEGKQAHYLRHLYFTDAISYVHMPKMQHRFFTKHITSITYDSEFVRQMKLLGEIPRKTMIRHLLIFGLPDLTIESLNQHLSFLGYLPLTIEHSLICGARFDQLLIDLFHLYEKECVAFSPSDKLEWFRNASRILDAYFIDTGNEQLRFMYFKALNL